MAFFPLFSFREHAWVAGVIRRPKGPRRASFPPVLKREWKAPRGVTCIYPHSPHITSFALSIQLWKFTTLLPTPPLAVPGFRIAVAMAHPPMEEETRVS